MREALLLISTLELGGAQRVVTLLANAFVGSARPVTVATLAPGPSAFWLDPRVETVHLDVMAPSASAASAVRNNLVAFRAVRRLVRSRRPGVLVSFMDRTNVLAVGATVGSGVPTVVSERTNPAVPDSSSIWTGLRDVAYARAATVVVPTDGCRAWMERSVPGSRVAVIPNPVLMPERPSERGPVVAGAGRLAPEKRFDLLIDAFVRADGPALGWSLRIAGDGPLRADLEYQAARAGLDPRAVLPGALPHGTVFEDASIFVLTSEFEGFPNALVEAMSWGCACIALDCDYGPAEILEPNETGLLVDRDDEDGLVDALRALLTGSEWRAVLGNAARRACSRYDVAVVTARWMSLLDSVARGA